MSFLDQAVLAEIMASNFSKFISQVPEDSATLNYIVTELYAIGNTLRLLHSAHNSHLKDNFMAIVDDVELVSRSSLRLTLNDMTDILSTLVVIPGPDGTSEVSQESYRNTWYQIKDYFFRQAGYTLSARLNYYGQMLRLMYNIVMK